MIEKTTEIATELIIQPPVYDGIIEDGTGVWSIDDDLDDNTDIQPFEVVERPVKQSLRQRIGHTIYVLAHSNYRREVRQRANDIVQDIAGESTSEKQVLPPRTRDYKTIPERRRHTRELALDIGQYIQTMRYMRRMMGALSLMTVDHLHIISPTPVPEATTQDRPTIVPITVVEEQLPPLDGDAPNDGDYIAKIVAEK